MMKSDWGCRPGPTQTGLYSHRRWYEASNFGFKKKRDCTIGYRVADLRLCFCICKKKTLFSHDAAKIDSCHKKS